MLIRTVIGVILLLLLLSRTDGYKFHSIVYVCIYVCVLLTFIIVIVPDRWLQLPQQPDAHCDGAGQRQQGMYII